MIPRPQSLFAPCGERGTKLIDFKKRLLNFGYNSLYLGLFVTISLGLLCAFFTYSGIRKVSRIVISEYYNTEENRLEREAAYFSSLQHFCRVNEISGNDTERIAKWTDENRYVYLLIYKDEEIYFSSDMSTNSKSDPTFMGGIVSFPSREELVAAAEKNDMYELVLTDCSLFASVAEFTDYLYLDLSHLLSLMAAVMIFGIFLIIYVSRIISRIKRLERDVAIVSGGEMTHTISNNGRDEIATLSENVENMRISIIDKLNREREIKEANNELVASISHDLRTPLTVLIGYIDMMKNHKECRGDILEYVTASENTAMRLKRLSDDMFKYSLAFGEPDGGVNLECYDASTLVDQLLSEHMLLLSERGFEIEERNVGRSFDGLKVYTDAPNLMRIIDNIFSNISKYADSAFPVEFTINRAGKSLILEIKNKIKSDPSKVESNGIGLKTCVRLSRLIADSFNYGEEDGYFVCRLALKLRSEDNVE